LPSDDGELGAEVRPRQPDPEAPFNGGAGLEGGLRDRLLSDVIELNRPPVGDTSNAEIELGRR
jgi:hypothetical protein